MGGWCLRMTWGLLHYTVHFWKAGSGEVMTDENARQMYLFFWISNVKQYWLTVFPHLVAAATILFWIYRVRKLFKFHYTRENLMRKLYEIFKLLWIQKRIVAAATKWGNTVSMYLELKQNSWKVGRGYCKVHICKTRRFFAHFRAVGTIWGRRPAH